MRSRIIQILINNFKHLPEAVLANVIYGFPARKLTVIGVTGTDGKTTTVNMIYQILKAAGLKVSIISTINAVVGGEVLDTGFHVTSPDAFTVQKLLKKALDAGGEYAVLEVTSHGLDQYRFWGVRFRVGVVTNITHDHLDYHRTLDGYTRAKLKLLRSAPFAVINHNLAGEVRNWYSGKLITFGLRGEFTQDKYKLRLKIPGEYNIENALAALAVAKILGIDTKVSQKSLENFEGLEGRMQGVKNDRGIRIFIDFAHTPNGLDKSLKTLRKLTSGKVISIFGAASQRDTKKRPMMGEISARGADITILTDEDPRFEDSNKIIDEIAIGALKVGAEEGINLFRQPDRTKAIKLGLEKARKGDIVGIFGKGHEKSMNYLGVETPWSELEAVRKALR